MVGIVIIVIVVVVVAVIGWLTDLVRSLVRSIELCVVVFLQLNLDDDDGSRTLRRSSYPRVYVGLCRRSNSRSDPGNAHSLSSYD